MSIKTNTDDRLLNMGILLQGLSPEECFSRIKSAFQRAVSQDREGKPSWGQYWELRVDKKDEEAFLLCQLLEQEYLRQGRERDL